VILCALGALAAPAVAQPGSSASAQRTPAVPRDFVGMMADGPIFSPGVNVNAQFAQMASAGVGRIRVEFNWGAAQPYRTAAEVPANRRGEFVSGPGGVPTDFEGTDVIVALAAEHHLSLLPVVIASPSWDAWPTGFHAQPVHDAPYANYLTALVHRYGPSGTFWRTHSSIPRRPITMWQIWNEPDLPYFWDRINFASSYLALLRAAHRAIKRADPRAQVVLASLTGASWRGLATIYHVHGARKLFDVVGENTYAPTPAGVISVLAKVRHTMDRNGDARKPLIDTEVGWPSALGKSGLTLGVATTQAGQAAKLAALLPLLASQRRALGLAGFYYYTWMSTDTVGAVSPWVFAGLFRYATGTHRIIAKPAFAVFRRVVLHLEGHG
jgi:hypothetical protein